MTVIGFDSMLDAGCPKLLRTPNIAGVSAEPIERVSSLIASMVLEALG